MTQMTLKRQKAQRTLKYWFWRVARKSIAPEYKKNAKTLHYCDPSAVSASSVSSALRSITSSS
jgi:hypothetical protein